MELFITYKHKHTTQPNPIQKLVKDFNTLTVMGTPSPKVSPFILQYLMMDVQIYLPLPPPCLQLVC